MYVFFNFGFLLLFYSAQDGIGSPVTYELCIYNKMGMQLIMTKIKTLVSKVENLYSQADFDTISFSLDSEFFL